ncbi:hypothetical protein HNP46_004231 [Pseudomonas nitritireducens]|uniref:Uncharacterized protein n=1 Tax=Pseudomonas nitroreducens TaxID=46680 RepID=A0A7W7KMY8_PSENT|nr:hypothetical protein [Pseudomonas nitritireducens]MBB4865350.1 hypothetical protein [Pseudomonas nitritireducens]
MTLSVLPSPPAGYEIILFGTVQGADRVYNPSENTWGAPGQMDFESIGYRVEVYHCVARLKNRVRADDTGLVFGVMPEHFGHRVKIKGMKVSYELLGIDNQEQKIKVSYHGGQWVDIKHAALISKVH